MFQQPFFLYHTYPLGHRTKAVPDPLLTAPRIVASVTWFLTPLLWWQQ